MNNFRLSIGLLNKSIEILFKRLLGKQQEKGWSLKTELIWATTRYTLLASNKFGLKWLKDLSNRFKPKPTLKNEIDIEEARNEIGGFLRIRPKANVETKTSIIYFHGGGYVIGSPNASIEFTSRLAISTDAEILVPFYPTAPEKRYPEAHEFSFRMVESILKDNTDRQYFLGGDSAGAALVLSAFKNISTNNKEKIKGCILISPWVEPTSNKGTIQSNAEKDIADEKYLLGCYNTYVNNQDIQNQYPLSFDKNNLIALPETLITIGTFEMLLDQSQRLNENLRLIGTKTTFISYPSMFHTFWNQSPSIKEADKIIDDISKWVKKA